VAGYHHPMGQPSYVEKLRIVFEARQRQNPLYSLRAFARDLGIDSSSLSKVLQGRRQLSKKAGVEVALNIGLDETETAEFLESHRANTSR